MAYGEIKVDTITFTDGGIDKSVSISGLVQNPTFSGNITVTGTISGDTLKGQTVSGVTVTGTTAQFASGTFTSITGTTLQGTTATYTTGSFTSLTGTTLQGTTATYTTGSFTSLTGTTTTGTTATFATGVFSSSISGAVITATSGVIASGTAANPSLSIVGDPNTGIYSPGADQVAISTNSVERVNLGTSEVVFNDGGNDIDFRIEGDTNANLFFVDASNDRVGLGTSSPQERLDLAGNGASFLRWEHDGQNGSYSTSAGVLRIGPFFAATDRELALFGDNSSGFWVTTGANSSLNLGTNKISRIFISSGGNVGIGTTSPATPFHVNGNVTITDKIIHEGDTDTLIRFPTINTFSIETDGSERARIDSTGRLLVGTSTSVDIGSGSSSLLQVKATDSGEGSIAASFYRFSSDAVGGIIALGKGRGSATGIVQDNDSLGEIRFGGSDGTDIVNYGASIAAEVDGTPGANDMPGRLMFSTTADGGSFPTERMSILATGDVCANASTRSNIASSAGTNGGFKFVANTTDASVCCEGFAVSTAARYHIAFTNPNGVVGSISTNGSATAFNTSSDYRLKENVVPLTGAIDRVQQLKPSKFNFKADPSKTVDGFLAHEAQAVVPECVTGEKDAVDENGKPQYQGIDQSKLVPLLTAALQEALAEIESLKARVTALEP